MNDVLPNSVLLVASDEEVLEGELPVFWIERLQPRRFGKVFRDDVSACQQVLGFSHHTRQLCAFLSSMLCYVDSHMVSGCMQLFILLNHCLQVATLVSCFEQWSLQCQQNMLTKFS